MATTAPAMSRDTADAARSALNLGRADDALGMLASALEANPSDAEALNLRCRVLFAEERWDEAIAACEGAAQNDPRNSVYHMWLGRAYGEKADRVNFVAAYKMAKLIRAEFETAVGLDPRNGDALSDLGQYYVEAPSVLGGGLGKAEGVARQLDGFAPDRAHELRARIAEEKKDYAGAEREFRAKISAASRISQRAAAQSWMDLGSFYRRRSQWDEMQAALESGAVAAADHGPELADGASTLIGAGRDPKLAAQWLRAYLDGNALSEDVPAFVAHTRLGELYKRLGDAAAADRELAAARGLASGFVPAQGVRTNTNR